MSYFPYPNYYYPHFALTQNHQDESPYSPTSSYIPPSNFYYPYFPYSNYFPSYYPSSDKINQEKGIEKESIKAMKVENLQKQEKSIDSELNKNKNMGCQNSIVPLKQKKTKRKHINKEKKQRKDEQFILFEQRPQQKKTQKQGRNNNSNVYRTFVKLVKSEIFRQNIESMFIKIKDQFNLTLDYNQFSSALKEKLPNFTNYINNKEFKRLYNGEGEFNKCFRILFHSFRRSFAFNHILTIAYRDRIKKENLDQFMKTLHFIEDILME